MRLSKEQKKTASTVTAWLNKVWQDTSKQKRKQNVEQFISIGGFAGTGKTTLISYLRKDLEETFQSGHYPFMHKKKRKFIKVAFCSFTGKAAQILQQKLEEKKNTFS